MEFLHCGPSYVSPRQLHILSGSSSTMNETLTKQMAPLRRELTRVFTKYPVDLSRRMNFEKEIQNLFHASFDQSIPSTLEERILYEKQLIKSIRYQLNKDQLILRRTVDNYNTYYLDFEDERIYIDAIFLANGYSLDFVEYHWRQFLKRFNFKLLSRIMARKREREEENLLETNQKMIQLHYLFDWGSRCEFNEKFQRLWLTILNEDLIFKQYGLKIQLNSKHCYSSNILLARSITY
ncbi:unnamed protein product [Rotaria magnacalcarata]